MNQKQEMNAFVKECITTALFALMKKATVFEHSYYRADPKGRGRTGILLS